MTTTALGSADTAALRLLVPGARGTTAHVQLLGPEGSVTLPGADAVKLEPGAVLDLSLGGLPEGDYTAVVDADQPILLGALVTRGAGVGADAATVSGAPLDRAWAPSQAVGGAGPLALPPRARGRLLVSVVPDDAVSGPATVTVEIVGPDGGVLGTLELEIPARVTTSVPLRWLLDPTVPASGLLDPTSSQAAPTGDVAGVVVRTSDPRIAWGVVLVDSGTTAAADPTAPAPPAIPAPDDAMVSLLSPLPPRHAEPQVTVRLR